MLSQTRLIVDEINQLLCGIDAAAVDAFYRAITFTPVVMAYATGRSGFLLRTFIMRLNHLGQRAYFVGDASTPPVSRDDCFVVMSGSGSTATSLGAAMEASRQGARIAAIVGSRISPMGQLAQVLVELPAPHKRGIGQAGLTSQQTAGSLFEQGAFLLLESLVLRRYEELGRDPMRPLVRHANLEA
jgi:6-phospho-3-hexuloisomerase